MKLDDLIKAATSRVETVRVVRTAINPLLWLDVMLATLALGAAIWVSDPAVRIGFFFLATLTVLATITAYFVLLFRDPDRLQSEEYRLRQRALRMVYRYRASPALLDATREIARMEDLPGNPEKGEEH